MTLSQDSSASRLVMFPSLKLNIPWHPYPLVWRAQGGAPETWETTDLLTGWFDDASYTLKSGQLGPGDTLVLYSDGLTDAFLDGTLRVQDAGVQTLLAHGKPSDLLETIAARLLQPARQGPQVDDVTLLMVRRRSASQPLLAPGAQVEVQAHADRQQPPG